MQVATKVGSFLPAMQNRAAWIFCPSRCGPVSAENGCGMSASSCGGVVYGRGRGNVWKFAGRYRPGPRLECGGRLVATPRMEQEYSSDRAHWVSCYRRLPI